MKRHVKQLKHVLSPQTERADYIIRVFRKTHMPLLGDIKYMYNQAVSLDTMTKTQRDALKDAINDIRDNPRPVNRVLFDNTGK